MFMRCRYVGLVLVDWSLQENSFLWSDGNLSGICLCHSWQIWKAAQGNLAKRAEVALSSCTPTLPSSTPSGPAFFDNQPGLAQSSQQTTKLSSSNSESWWEFVFLATIIVVLILFYFLLSAKHAWKDLIVVWENMEAQICFIWNMFARQTVCITEIWLF